MPLYHQQIINRLSLLTVLLCTLIGLAGLHPSTSRAERPASESQRLYRADQVPPGLTATDWRQIVAQIEQQTYAPTETDQPGHFQAANLTQGWRLNFAPTGLTVVRPSEGNWHWGLRLAQVGRVGAMRSMSRPRLSAAGETVTYRWGEGLTELIHNRAGGLKQDFILMERPAGTGPLRLELAMSGTLTNHLAGGTISFYDRQGRLVLTYSGLAVYDATGRRLPAHFELSLTAPMHRLPPSKIQNPLLALVIDDAAAHYPLVIDPLVQQAYLKASNPGGGDGSGWGDSFGLAVAISGDTVVVGAEGEASNAVGVDGDQSDNSALYAGAAYIFTRSGGVWSQQAYLKASNTQGGGFPGLGDRFGAAVAISGDTVVIGAPSEDSNEVGVNGNQNDNSAENAGAAYVFTRSGGVWSQQAYLKASNTEGGDGFGLAVAISGDTVVVGAPGEDSNATGVNGDQTNNSALDAGAAYIFTRNGTAWSQQAYLKASNTGMSDWFGDAVAISGDTVVVGAPLAEAAYIFTRNGTAWSEQAYLKASNTGGSDYFGYAVAISGDTAVVGAPYEDSNAAGVDGDQANNSAPNAGAAYIFTRNGAVWSQQAYLKASNTGKGDEFGAAVAISGDTVVVGARAEASNAVGINGDQADNSAFWAGAAYIFTRSGSSWSQQTYLKASNTEGGDLFGYAVAISGETVVAGAFNEASSSPGVNGNQADNSASVAGAAYIFLNAPDSEMAVLGNAIEIAAGDTTPTLANHTDFGSVILGGAITRTFTVSNSGTATLNLTGSPLVSITGPGAGDFSLVRLPTTPVFSNTTTTFQVRFNPSVAGTRPAILSLANNDSDENPYTFAIQGTGSSLASLPEIAVLGNGHLINDGDATPSPADHTNFGSLSLGGAITRTFTISNSGQSPLMLTGDPLVAIIGPAAGDFSLVTSPAPSIGPGSSAPFQVRFSPNLIGVRVATLTLTNNDTDETPYEFAIQGMGVAGGENFTLYLPLILK